MLIPLRIIYVFCLIQKSQLQLSGLLRLRDGPIAGKGRLEIFYNSQWGTVCDDDFDHKDSIVACRQIGYSTGFMVNNTFIPDGTGPIWLDDIRCSGSENRLDNCLHSGWGVHNCEHTDDVGVECFTPTAGSLRIIEETMTMQGRLEIYYNGSWGTICDDGFEDVDALVACKQMGYSAGVTLGNIVTDGSGTILLDDVGCTGKESALTSCGNTGWGVHNCGHHEDVGVQCFIRNKVDGSWGIWSSWGSCSLTCGGGVQYRTRECNNPTPINGGNCCEGISYSSQICNSNVCAVNGNWGSWSSWSTCSTSCGGGIAKRTRVCNNPVPSNGGLNCTENSVETMPCKTDPCPVNGGWSIWSDWGSCNVTCGGGIQERTRICDNPPPVFGGSNCTGLKTEQQICSIGNCPVNGNWGVWSLWNSCSLSCGNGSTSRYRNCNSPAPSFGGLHCSGVSFDSTYCKTDPCPVDGGWSIWSCWGSCSVTCGGGGIQQRTRLCDNPPPDFGGSSCSGLNTTQQICNSGNCPVNGNWEQWSNWSNCSENCGFGIQNRSRDCNNPFPANCGIFCQGLPLEVQMCNSNCPDVEATFEVAGQHSNTALAGVAIGCVVSTAGLIFIIQFMIRCIYKGKKETHEHNNSPEECYEDLKRKRISGTPNTESFDRLKHVSSGTYDNLTENNYENLQLESIEARVSNIYQNS